MDAARTIRESMEAVAALRASAAAQPALGAAVAAIKRAQAARFRRCYSDLLASKDFGPAACFFLEELYGEADYSERDQQFARIAGTLATVFPASVVATAVALAQLHALTEELDHSMAAQCLRHGVDPLAFGADDYIWTWHSVGRRPDRERQLSGVIELGRDLTELTRQPGLALLLKLMRRPAASAGMAPLQQFLERGFAIFAALSRSQGRVDAFLSAVARRESAWLTSMFENQRGSQAANRIHFLD